MSNYIYMRVSSRNQGERETWKTQLYELRNYAKTHGLSIEKEFLDIASTRKVRKALYELLDTLQENDIILVYDQDRLSRDTIETLTLMNLFKEKNIKVLTPRGELEFNTPEQEFTITVLSATKKLEREVINRRIRSGIQRYRATHGRWGRPKAMTPIKKKMFKKYYYEKGLTNMSSLCKLLDITYHTLRNYMREQGIPLPRERKRLEATK